MSGVCGDGGPRGDQPAEHRGGLLPRTARRAGGVDGHREVVSRLPRGWQEWRGRPTGRCCWPPWAPRWATCDPATVPVRSASSASCPAGRCTTPPGSSSRRLPVRWHPRICRHIPPLVLRHLPLKVTCGTVGGSVAKTLVYGRVLLCWAVGTPLNRGAVRRDLRLARGRVLRRGTLNTLS